MTGSFTCAVLSIAIQGSDQPNYLCSIGAIALIWVSVSKLIEYTRRYA